ncbi:restriction endonuclease subunit S [Streptococcus suis]|uniref:restriction endonuclease subunit S n=1 Tax=Streptococcus suis TaxID=1307 RepID=UPI002AB4D091|nr:restriction endonuclease subunit S [Streptococcus suis]MDY7594221.1 restriction endonuclease subunit S [Streptococcus suis]
MGSYPTPPAKRRRCHKKALSPRLAKLDKEFEEAGGEWREYPVSKLFKIKSTLSFNKDMLTVGDGYDYVTRTSQNQGILQSTGFVNQENVNDAGVWSLGLLQMDFFYRNKPWYAGQFVRKVIPLISMTRHYVLYFQTLLNKLKPKLLSGLVRDVDETFLSSHFILPMKNGEIDFLYIENYIKTLEAERIETLEAYLTVTGLKEYHLTKNDEKILDRFAKLSDTESRVEEWGSYNLLRLYGASTRGKRLKSADRYVGHLPFVTAGEDQTGISGYIGNEVEVFEPHTITIDMFGSAKYRGYAYGADDHVAVVHTEHLQRHSSMFVATCIHSVSSSGQFSYARNFYAKDADELNISLPTLNNQPDYTFMSDFIKVIEKLVIKDLVEWTDKKIQATKEVVAQH